MRLSSITLHHVSPKSRRSVDDGSATDRRPTIDETLPHYPTTAATTTESSAAVPPPSPPPDESPAESPGKIVTGDCRLRPIPIAFLPPAQPSRTPNLHHRDESPVSVDSGFTKR